MKNKIKLVVGVVVIIVIGVWLLQPKSKNITTVGTTEDNEAAALGALSSSINNDLDSVNIDSQDSDLSDVKKDLNNL